MDSTNPVPIRKVVIPVAGFGTRLLPATKSVPKEMMPIVDRPIIHYLVEEAVASGIEEVIFINHPDKKAIEDYFKPAPELEKRLASAGKFDVLAELQGLTQMAKISYAYQPNALGNGHAILMAKDLVGDEPFAVVWGDDLFESETPRLKQLIDTYNQFGASVLALVQSHSETSFPEYCRRYGCVGAEQIGPKIHKINSIIEKPEPSEAPSDLFSIGGYIYTPTLFEILEATKPGKSDEIWLADATTELLKREPIYGSVIEGTYCDVGNKMGFLKANIHYGLRRADTSGELRHYLESID